VLITFTSAGGWSLPANCDWDCDAGYDRIDDACLNSRIVPCQDVAPENATSSQAPVLILFIEELGWSTPESCAWACNTDFALVGDACLDQQLVACQDAAPANAVSITGVVTITYTTAGGWSLPADCGWSCIPPFENCDQISTNGCEADVGLRGACACTPGAQQSCYTGPPWTEDVAGCHGGQQTCDEAGTSWGPCEGEQTPAPELCGNGVDENCNGIPDEDVDEDGDSFGRCAGDCCDTAADGCLAPMWVNPGAIDVPGNGVDDDCDGAVDNGEPAACSASQLLGSVTAVDLARALDLCADAATEGHGLVSAELLRADGTGAPADIQVGVHTAFGAATPQRDATLAALSSGTARDEADPGYIYPDGSGWNGAAETVSAPSAYLAAHGGQLQSSPTCSVGSPMVYDSVLLRLRLRVPTNARGLAFRFKFFSSEYPEWVCTSYNDFFLAMIYSVAEGLPADRNLSYDANANPVSVNSAFFTECGGCPGGNAGLVGTGYPPDDAGATGWLRSTAPVAPGETLILDFVIWDTGDQGWDSLVLLDGFEWLADPTSVGTTPTGG
jgi:hypothetical protein